MSGFRLRLVEEDGVFQLVEHRLPEAPPRFRYFQERNGPMFGWTTERVEGSFASFVHLPVGKGSRSGKAVEWSLVEDSISAHDLRRDAKARAWALYQAWLDGEEKPW